MNGPLSLVPVGSPEPQLMEWLREALEERFAVPCQIVHALDPARAFHPERQQYHSTELLNELAQHVPLHHGTVLGVGPMDLYVPILTFVFGEAELGGDRAIVSYHRLRQEFYGLPADRDLLAKRLLIECVHELGHTMNLRHCHDYRCVMSSSHSVERVDLKEPEFCAECMHSLRVREVCSV